MKIVLRHTQTGLFLSGWRNWSKIPLEAIGFANVKAAVQLVKAEGLENLEIVVQGDAGDPEKVIPLRKRSD